MVLPIYDYKKCLYYYLNSKPFPGYIQLFFVIIKPWTYLSYGDSSAMLFYNDKRCL